ncbi:Hypothetical protein D9617_61g013260 [Elsinoe fawcettii]|nr:Hypothetical protein D9617_61g013260 [Elsinoe fawcettii]
MDLSRILNHEHPDAARDSGLRCTLRTTLDYFPSIPLPLTPPIVDRDRSAETVVSGALGSDSHRDSTEGPALGIHNADHEASVSQTVHVDHEGDSLAHEQPFEMTNGEVPIAMEYYTLCKSRSKRRGEAG